MSPQAGHVYRWRAARLRLVRQVTLSEAAARLGINAATLRQQIANGKFTAVRHGRDWWVEEAEVYRYARESRRETKRWQKLADETGLTIDLATRGEVYKPKDGAA